jgi:AraC-like DNA-binding protein
MSLSLALSCFFISFILLLYSSKINVANYFLSLYFFIIGLILLTIQAQINGSSIYFAAILLIQFSPIYALLGPSLYFYLHFFFYQKYRFTYLDLIHLVPVLFFLVNEWPYLVLPFSEKMLVAKLVQLKLSNLFTIPLAFVNVQMALLVRLYLTLLYLLYGYVLFFKFSKSLSSPRSTILERRRKLSWVFLFLFLSSVVFGGMTFALNETVKLTYYLYLSISGFGILFLIISLILYPSILYGRRFVDEEEPGLKNVIKLPKIILLSQMQFIEIDKLVVVFMVDFPYTRADFNLNKVSLDLGIPKHHLTYYLHSHLHLSFNSWRDQLRIIYAKDLISNGDAQSFTLESIGNQAGFKSRDKFTRAFKAQTGSNPSDFIKNQ